jgi:hypothetical protein
MTRRALRPLAFLAALAALWAATQSVDGLSVGWLALAPALMLLAPLLGGRYVGETTLRRLAVRRATVPRRALATAPVRWRILDATPHGGLLLARRTAGRAPPLAAPAR